MKKILSLLILLAILLTFAPYVSAEGICAVNVICDSLTSKVSLSGIVGQRAGVPVTVSILKEGKDTDFSKDTMPATIIPLSLWRTPIHGLQAMTAALQQHPKHLKRLF